MDFFFPDSQDQIDPSFDFERESSSPDRVRQRDDRYAHELISPAPYTGILLSKALVDGPGSKYTFAQRHRLYRLGVRRFFRLDDSDGPALATLGDCGAFNYVREEKPPYSVEDVVDFYDECGFDYGISVDHVILGYIPIERLDVAPGNRARLEGFVGAVTAAPRRREPSPGLGEDVRLCAKGLVGSGLELDGELLQLSGFSTA